ncbi:hypothetical protein DXG01_007139 [Tephrocybe rancida]|nr:hypothetical protein DXG01_007139 [Tephrocybe rancida]
MAYVYTPQNQQWTPQEVAAYNQHQQMQQQYNHYAAPLNVLRPNMAVAHQPSLPVSPYSSLTGAVDYSQVTSSAARKKSAGSIYKNRTNANPYPAAPQYCEDTSRSQGRSRSNSQTQALASAGRSARQTDLIQAQRMPVHVPIPPPSGPTNHVLVPQPEYFDERDKKWRYGPRYKPINFQTANIPELGVRVGKVAHSQYPPAIEGADEEIFQEAGDREIQLWILWPGYSSEPLKKRVKTQAGRLTRELLLTLLAHAVLDYAYDIHRKKIPIERGYEKWAIGSKADENVLVGGELFITRLVHRGGANWQVEIWAPRR